MVKRQGLRKKHYESRILREVHETAKALYRAGTLDRATMDEFDALALGFRHHLATMPNVGEDQDFTREQTAPRLASEDE